MNNSLLGLYATILFIGLLSSLMTFLNSMLAVFSGLYLGGLIVHLVGIVPAFLLFLFFDWDKRARWAAAFSTRKQLFSAGLIGALTLIMSAYCINASGAFVTSIAIVVGQFILSLVIDLKGWFGFPKITLGYTRILAIVLIAAGSVMLSL